MSNLTAFQRALLLLGTAFMLGQPALLHAQQAVSATPSLTFAALAATETKVSVPAEDLGTGVFSHLPFKVSATVGSGYDDNVATSNAFKQGSAFTNGNIDISYDFGDPRVQLSLDIGVGGTYYWDSVAVPGVSVNNYDINTFGKFSLTYKASPRLTLSMADYLAYQTEPDFTISQGQNRRGENYFFTQDKFTANYLWSPRFATATSYTLGALHYDDSNVGFFSDRWENTFGNEFRFLLAPSTTLVAEYRFQIITYEHVSRDSNTHFVLGGFDHSFDPRLNVSFRGGAEFRDYQGQGGGSRTSPYFEGTLNYMAGKQTTVTWTSRYAIEEPDVLLSQSRETFRTGLSVKHDLTARISGTLGVYYTHDDYQSVNQPGVFSPAFTEQSVDLAVTLRYAITRYLGVQVGYNFTDVSSDISIREYTRNRVWGAINATF
jgi:hypothetical protein